jgi:hypothetical protein
MVLQEGAIPPLVALSKSGTPRAREKAQALLRHFRDQRHAAKHQEWKDAMNEEYNSILKNNVWIVVPRPRNKYMDDLFLTGEEDLIAQTKRELSKEFEIKDLGQMHYFLGLEIWQKTGEIFLTQSKYAIDILCRFGMMDCKSMTTQMISKLKKLQDQVTGSDPEDPTVYRQIIGSLMYLVHTISAMLLMP